jgi:hypothetical protein
MGGIASASSLRVSFGLVAVLVVLVAAGAGSLRPDRPEPMNLSP